MRLLRPHFARPVSRRGRVLLGLAAGLLLLVPGTGVYAWHRHEVYVASPQGTVDRLNASIAEQNLVLFAETVNVGALAHAFARALAAVAPDTDETRTADLIQLSLLAVLRGEEAPGPVRETAVPILPDEARARLVQAPFALENGNPPVAATTLFHPALGELPVRLRLVPAGQGWRVDDLLNGPDLIRRYLSHVDELERRQREVEARHNQENREALARLLPDSVCSGGVTRISGNVPLLSLSMTSGPNPGPETVEAWGATLTLNGTDGSVLARPRVMLTSKIQPGSGAAGAWSQDIDEARFRRLERAGPLSCTVAIDYVILTGGKIYNVRPE